ncbi:MAG: sugar-binding protein [Gimesia sp.]|nr:sugar-binding protein [Gimesia sp.]
MRRAATCIAMTLVLLNMSPLWAQVETFDIPKLDQIKIDGDFSDWKQKPGFGVEVLLQEAGTFKNATDHNVHFRLGWNQEGLLIYLVVQDNNWVEYPEKGKYYSADVVEVFLANKRGDEDVCQWYITPGMTPKVKQAGVRFRELRRGPTKGMPSDLKVFREKLSDHKYRMEILAPWSSIGKEGATGNISAFQIWVNDKDQGSSRKRYMSIFYPAKGASYASGSMHNIRLVDNNTASQRISSLGEYDMQRFQPFVRLWATAERAGKKVTVKQGNTILGTAVLNDKQSPGRSTAKILLPPAPAGKPYQKLGVYLENQKVNSLSLPYSDIVGSLKTIFKQRANYRKLFKLDEPWADFVSEPLLERHRGLAAAGLNLLEQQPLPNSESEMEILSKTIEMLTDLEKGEDYFGKQRNGLWGYYYCKADGTGQRFSMTIPKDFNPQKTYPLYVNLHGNGGRPLPTKSVARQSDYFQIRPWGRGDISYFGLGEVDVLESMKHVLKWYPIDADRICLGGHSMGGNATWDLGSKYTNLFACLVPKAGRSGDDYYENFRHLPALIQHGAKDGAQPVDFGRYTVSRLEQLGFPVIYKEFPEDGHGIRNPYPVEEWFVQQRRPRSPHIITYTCDTTANGEIYWTRIRRFLDPHKAATIDARVTDQNQVTQVDLKLKNIEVIELNLNDLPSAPSKPLILKLGKQKLKIAAPRSPQATLIFKNREWQLIDSWNPPASKIRPYQPGGAANLYSGEPLLIVYPTTGKEETRKQLEESARNIVLYGGFGRDMITGSVPIKADKDVTAADIQHKNLILFGGPEYNTITSQLADMLPVKVNQQNQFVVAGHTPMDVDQSALLLTYYNPLATQQLIHLIWQDEIPPERRERYARFARNKLPGASGRHPHNIPDLQINSPQRSTSIRRQFTHDWKLKARQGTNKKQSPRVIKEGVDMTKMRLLQTKANVDFAINMGYGSWTNGSTEPPTLDQFRYRNYRMTTFKASIKGKHLEKILADPANKYLKTFPPIPKGTLKPATEYSIVAPEGILWAARSIRNYWTNMVAGPDILKSDVIKEVYGVDESK